MSTTSGQGAFDLPARRFSAFKYLIGAAALFIAGCSAFFSVKGLGLLFVGAAVPVMIMAASLELGKLVAASFLYRYWSQIRFALRIYLTLAVVVLIAITSLGNYGFLARAYEQTNSQVLLLEQQIVSIQRELEDTQRQIDGSRNQLGKTSDAGRQDIATLQQRIAQANGSLDASLLRLEERRKSARDKRDHDIKLQKERMTELAGVLKKSLESEDTAIAELNQRVAVLDRAVEAYTAQGGGGFLKADGVRKGQSLREQQQPERTTIAETIAQRQKSQEDLRAEHAKTVDTIGRDIAAVEEQFKQETARLDTEEQSLRKARADAVAAIEKQLADLQNLGQTSLAQGSTQIEGLYQRLRTGNDEIRRLREQIAATDIGSYRFVARAFNAPTDDVVKWLMLVMVLVFDPLAVTLTVGFNVAVLRDRRAQAPAPQPASPSRVSAPRLALWRWVLRPAAGLAGLALFAALLAGGYYAGTHLLKQQARTAHAALLPADSFAVLTLRPADLRPDAPQAQSAQLLASLTGNTLSDALTDLLRGGLDSSADLYAFAKFPTARNAEPLQRPTMLFGLVARVADPAAAESALSKFVHRLTGSLNPASPLDNAPTSRSMVRFGRGRYLDPQGGFFTFALTDREAIVLVEIEGDPARPTLESEIRLCLADPQNTPASFTQNAAKLPARAIAGQGALALWFDAARCFADMPKNPAAQARYQQLQAFLGFDLLLSVAPDAQGQLSFTADYAYRAERFAAAAPSPLETLAKLPPADDAGIPGRLMDRCAGVLDYDALIEYMKLTLAKPKTGKPATEVLVEKSIASPRAGRFLLTAHYDPQAAPPLVAALQSISR